MNEHVDFDKFSENYNQLLNDRTKFFSASEEYFARYKVDVIRRQVTSPINTLLEYGCGIGRNIPFLRRAFPNAVVMGSDISCRSLAVARKENPGIEFFQEGKRANLSGEFDLILVAGVYHHIPTDERAAVSRTLFWRVSPQGSLFVFEHNPFNPVTRRIVNACPYDEDAALLKPTMVKKLLRQADFHIEAHSYCLFVPPRLSRLIFVERLLGWLPLGGQYWIQAKRSR